MISILRCLKKSPVKINQNSVKSFSNFRLYGAVASFDFKNNALFNKLKAWSTHFSIPNEAKHLKDVLIKQQNLQKVQDERREIGKLITDARRLFIEKQDKIFRINRWENVQEYVNLRKEEAELIKKEYELTAKFEALDKIEKELFLVLNNTVRGSYEREKTKIMYTKYWGTIISIVIVMFYGVITRTANVEEKSFYSDDNLKIQMNETVLLAVIGIVVISIISGCCR